MTVVSDKEFIQQLTAENQRLATLLNMLERKTECHWILDESSIEEGAWQTFCGNAMYLEIGTPKDNGYVYCPYCGNRITEEIIDSTLEDEDE